MSNLVGRAENRKLVNFMPRGGGGRRRKTIHWEKDSLEEGKKEKNKRKSPAWRVGGKPRSA